MSNTTGPNNNSTKPADRLVEALEATGQFTAESIENGCAVRVETVARRTKGSAPVAVTTVWLPDESIGAGYIWTTTTDNQLDPFRGLDAVVAAISATLRGSGL